jgi:CheY-like chemotaxis protein
LQKRSEFILTLQLVVDDCGTSVKDGTAGGTDSEKMENRMTKRILIVDDNVDAADTLEALLGMDGFEVTTVYDGIAAITAAGNVQPDVIVMDIGMPGMDGYDAARMIRKQPGGEKTVLIALTGWGQSADKNRASEAGFNHHLVKPVDYDMLMKCVHA